MKEKFTPAISILIHENPSFFEIQCINIRNYYPNAIIVVHVNEGLWNFRERKIKKICLDYDIIINPKHLITNWATPSLFDAMLGNINILNDQPKWTHYIFMASNELFVSDLLEKKCNWLKSDEILPIIWDAYCGVTPLEDNPRDREGVLFDKGLSQFIVDKEVEIKTGLDFGRVITRRAFDKLIPLLNEYWKGQVIIPISYSQSEVVLPTLIEYLGKINEIKIIRDLFVSTWISNYQSGALEDYIIVKKIPRDKHDPIVKKIMKGIDVNYSTTVFDSLKSFTMRKLDSLKSSIKRNVFLSKVFYKHREIISVIIKYINRSI